MGPEKGLVSRFSEPAEFTTGSSKVELLSPAEGESVSYQQPIEFRWKEVPGAEKYQLVVYNQTNGVCSGVLWNGTHQDEAPRITINSSGVSGTATDQSDKCWRVSASTPAELYGPTENALGMPSEMGHYSIKKSSCSAQQVAGGYQSDSRYIDLGKSSGSFTLTYTTYTMEDQIDVYYEGVHKWSSDCVPTGQTDPNNFDSPGIYLTSPQISFNGNATGVQVVVTPWCDKQPGDAATTEWAYTVNCPP
jgi:hypothetical protein